jgi:hypothetical protein
VNAVVMSIIIKDILNASGLRDAEICQYRFRRVDLGEVSLTYFHQSVGINLHGDVYFL